MTYLLVQTFLLLLGAYFAGALSGCLLKQAIYGTQAKATEVARQPVVEVTRPPISEPVAPVRPVVAEAPVAAATAAAAARAAVKPVVAEPRGEHDQPKIQFLPRPKPVEPKPGKDSSRFIRALIGPDPNEGMPRRAILELRPAVLTSPTGPPHPWPPKPKPKPEPAPEVVLPPPVKPKPAKGELRPQTPDPAPQPARAPAPVTPQKKPGADAPQDATGAAAAAAAAVAAAKAAAAAAAVVTPALKGASTADEKRPDEQPVEAEVREASVEAVPTPAPGGDDFQRIRAIDSATEVKLKSNGITRFEEMARWSPADVNRINQALGLDGRIDSEQWIEQAQILAKGGETYYSRNRASALRTAAVPLPATDDKPRQANVTPLPAAAAAASPAAGGPNRSISEIANAAAAAIAAASASVTRGVRPAEPISPLAKADPNVVMPAKLSDAIKERVAQSESDGGEDDGDAAANPGLAALAGKVDDLKRIGGIGVLIEKRLNALGIGRYEQIANWTSSDIDRVNQALEFKGRVERERWVEQARILATGGHTEFSHRVDRGEVESSRDD